MMIVPVVRNDVDKGEKLIEIEDWHNHVLLPFNLSEFLPSISERLLIGALTMH